MQNIIHDKTRSNLIREVDELFESGAIQQARDVPSHFTSEEIALIADYIIKRLEQERINQQMGMDCCGSPGKEGE